MAGSLTSDSSRTLSLSAENTKKSTMSGGGGGPSPLLLQALSANPHEFLMPAPKLHNAALSMAKQYLDPLAAVFTKGGAKKSEVLEKIYLDGFDVDQVWEQVRIVVDAVEGGVGERKAIGSGGGGVVANGKKRKAVQFEEEEGSGSGSEEEGSIDYEEVPEDELDDEVPDSDDEDEDEIMDNDDGGVKFLDEPNTIELGSGAGEEEGEDEDEDEEAGEYTEDVHGLNDGFFSIDDFNRQTEFLELQDMRGGENNSDDEDDGIDYNADPTTLEDEDEDEEAITLKAKTPKKDDYEEDSDDELSADQENANDLMYEDFFAPPPRKSSGKNRAPREKKPWKQALGRKPLEDDDFTAIESDMARVRRDLFDDDASEHDSDIDMDNDPSNPLNRRSTHEKRQAALTEQIRALETANVAKRDWTLSGEARANARPVNSLLEEDLDFERAGKPVPVITQEVTEGLEDMIKRRILASDFDEVIRRRPDDVGVVRRGRVELDDSKPTDSLAAIYEKEHLRAIDPVGNPSEKDEKLAKEHAEIEELFADVSRKLDALTSWHYTPKPPKPSLSIVADVAAITMEEAQPTAAAGGGLAANVSMLAPQEVYAPAKGRAVLPIGGGEGREVVMKGGAAVSTREMTRDEKQRRRRREKAKIKKRNAAEGNKGGANAKDGSKKAVMQDLKRGGVKVIGKGGETRDVDGGLVKEKSKGRGGSSGLKL